MQRKKTNSSARPGLMAMTPSGLIALLALLYASLAPANSSPDEDEMLLHNKFGELCTMCEATVLCAAGDVTGVGVPDLEQAEGGPYTLYHFHTKTFFGQIATIYDYMIRWIEPVITEKRPLTVYTIPAPGDPSAARGRTETWVELSLEPPVITIDEREIERRSREWRAMDGRVVGSCKRLPLRETWAYLQAGTPWPELVATRNAGAAE